MQLLYIYVATVERGACFLRNLFLNKTKERSRADASLWFELGVAAYSRSKWSIKKIITVHLASLVLKMKNTGGCVVPEWTNSIQTTYWLCMQTFFIRKL